MPPLRCRIIGFVMTGVTTGAGAGAEPGVIAGVEGAACKYEVERSHHEDGRAICTGEQRAPHAHVWHDERQLARAAAFAGQGGVACLHLLHGHGRRRTQRVKLVVAPCWIGMSRTLCASLRRTHEMHDARPVTLPTKARPCVED